MLLGTGGLLRAYTKAAKDALDNAGITEILPRTSFLVRCPYALADRIRLETVSFAGEIENVTYEADVCFTVLVLEEQADAYAARIFDLTSGTVRCEAL